MTPQKRLRRLEGGLTKEQVVKRVANDLIRVVLDWDEMYGLSTADFLTSLSVFYNTFLIACAEEELDTKIAVLHRDRSLAVVQQRMMEVMQEVMDQMEQMYAKRNAKNTKGTKGSR